MSINYVTGETRDSKMVEETTENWRKSSYSADASNCVEVGQGRIGIIHIRDSKNCTSGHLPVDSANWRKLMDRIRMA